MKTVPRPSIPTGSDAGVDRLRREADRCVACGLCVPRCPTYRKTLNEADSPRGRIFMMAAVLEGALPLSAELAAHIDLCLGCRACEGACPSLVRYGHLVDGVRSLIEPLRARPLRHRVVRRVLFASAARPRIFGGLAWLRRPSHRQRPCPPAREPRAAVALFLGCVARLTDAETLRAASFVLGRLGYAVHIPARQGCCGALYRHNGDIARSERMAGENRDAFAGLDVLAILHVASGCGAALAEYDPPLAAPVLDADAFLATAEGWADMALAPLPATIAVHEPCASRNVLRDEGAAYALLRRIPGATVVPLPGNDQCCGAAGMYSLLQPEMAGALLRDKIDAIEATGTRYVATSNPGCAMHLAKGLRKRGLAVEVVHPVSLIARQMGYISD